MSGETVREVENFTAPYGRQIKLEDVIFDSGMQLLRVTIREGRRFTILDIDAESADKWASAMSAWSAASRTANQA